MSSDCCVAFYGVRYEPKASELEALETREHELMKSARKARLAVFWGNFASPDEKYYMFIGGKVGILGPENVAEVEVSEGQMSAMVDEVRTKLKDARIEGEPKFYLQWMPD